MKNDFLISPKNFPDDSDFDLSAEGQTFKCSKQHTERFKNVQKNIKFCENSRNNEKT